MMMFSSRLEGDALGRAHDELAAGQALAHVVVAVAGQLQRQALGDERAEALAACAGAVDGVDVIRAGRRRTCG